MSTHCYSVPPPSPPIHHTLSDTGHRSHRSWNLSCIQTRPFTLTPSGASHHPDASAITLSAHLSCHVMRIDSNLRSETEEGPKPLFELTKDLDRELSLSPLETRDDHFPPLFVTYSVSGPHAHVYSHKHTLTLTLTRPR
jgi:hypothetical protein